MSNGRSLLNAENFDIPEISTEIIIRIKVQVDVVNRVVI